MTTQHTSGPWHLGINPGPLIYGPKGEQVADLRGEMLERDENRANASLIAAAPELLKALEAIAVSATEFADLGVPMKAECAGIISNWAKTAIAKAKGQ